MKLPLRAIGITFSMKIGGIGSEHKEELLALSAGEHDEETELTDSALIESELSEEED
jgi:hypothetical protein